MRPVSYTHLDVYKRQVLYRSEFVCGTVHAAETCESHYGDFNPLWSTAGTAAVSYTHLVAVLPEAEEVDEIDIPDKDIRIDVMRDVYKRQGEDFGIARKDTDEQLLQYQQESVFC